MRPLRLTKAYADRQVPVFAPQRLEQARGGPKSRIKRLEDQHSGAERSGSCSRQLSSPACGCLSLSEINSRG
jgi:hypothetical protein